MSRNTRCAPGEGAIPVRRNVPASIESSRSMRRDFRAAPAASSPPTPARRIAARLAALLAAVAVAAGAMIAGAAGANVPAPPLPAAVRTLAPDLRAQGGGELRFLGLPVYDGWFWTTGAGWSLDQAFALDLHYHRNLDGASIAERSSSEIEKLGRGSAEQRARWAEAMKRIFPNVTKGDRITGVHTPPGRVQFFANGTLIGSVVDRDFAQAFFGIWLDPRTSRADFRRKLLGEAGR
jgi:hypothetical protein